MKAKLKLLFLTMALITFATSCNKDADIQPITDVVVVDDLIEEKVPMGTISLNAIVKDVIDVQTGKAPPTLGDVLTNLQVRMSSFDANVTIDQPYSSFDGGVIELPVGYYDFLLRTSSGPLYAGEGNFSIAEGVNTDVSISLDLLDMAVTINFDSEIETNYPLISASAQTSNYLFSNGMGAISWLWGIADNGEQRYFAMDEIYDPGIGFPYVQGNNSADLTITLTAPSTTGDITASKMYTGVKANQHYNITINYTTPSTVTLVITLGDEEVIEDTINFPN